MAYSMSHMSNPARVGSTISARVLGICFPPISNMTHLLIIYVGCPLLFRPNLAMAHPRHIVPPHLISPLAKLIMRHIFLTGHGNHEVLFCLCDRLWPQFFGTKHCGHSSDDSARAWNFAGGVVAPDMR